MAVGCTPPASILSTAACRPPSLISRIVGHPGWAAFGRCPSTRPGHYSRRVPTEGAAVVADAKRLLRARLLAAPERAQCATDLRDRVLALPEVESGPTIACYVSTAQEPGTEDLLHSLSGLGHTILLPILRPDFDVSWAEHKPGALRTARFGISEPTGREIGLDAIVEADVVISPGLAVDRSGGRLGRGGGSFDRVFARLAADTLRVVLVYDDEVLDVVPADDHDRHVHVAVTPRRTLRLRAL